MYAERRNQRIRHSGDYYREGKNKPVISVIDWHPANADQSCLYSLTDSLAIHRNIPNRLAMIPQLPEELIVRVAKYCDQTGLFRMRALSRSMDRICTPLAFENISICDSSASTTLTQKWPPEDLRHLTSFFKVLKIRFREDWRTPGWFGHNDYTVCYHSHHQ